jgi:hypothetical protein
MASQHNEKMHHNLLRPQILGDLSTGNDPAKSFATRERIWTSLTGPYRIGWHPVQTPTGSAFKDGRLKQCFGERPVNRQ